MDQAETLKVMMALCGGPDDLGDEARFVGGCVRDAILNRSVYDIDIATVWTPDEVIKRLEDAEIKAIPTGLAHGTVTAVVNGSPFEITTLRKDIKTDGRHAAVEFTDDWCEDASRRDFTMNAMYATVRGEISDYFNGLEDARSGVVRFINDPNTRISEDYLRILRFYRFSAHYAKVDALPDARAACKGNVQYLSNLSAERVQVEVFKLLTSDECYDILLMMKEDGVFEHILKSFKNFDALAKLMELEDKLDSKTYIPRRIACLIGFDADAVEESAMSLRLSNADRKSIEAMCAKDTLVPHTLSDHELRVEIYQRSLDEVRNSMLMYAAYNDVSADDIRSAYEFVNKTRLPDFPVEGEDLKKRGIKQGKNFGDILRTLETWWVDQDFSAGRTACLDKLDKIIGQK